MASDEQTVRDGALADAHVQKFVGEVRRAQDHRRAGQARQRGRLRCRHARVASRCACAASFALAACGFRLAGSEHLPPVLARPYLSVKDPYTDFAREFEHQLKSAGAVLQPGRQDATATIEVTKDLVEQRTLSVSARNIPTDYELIYTVTFAVQGPD